MADDTRARLSALELENASLKERLARLENSPPKVVVAPRREEDRVRILNLTPGVSRNLPTEDEARALLRIVTARYPQLKWKYSAWLTPDEELESFQAAFAFICSLTRTEEPTKKFARSWWVDSGQQYCREVGVQGVIRSLLPAIVASRCIPYCLEDASLIWLDPYRGRGRAVDDTAWRGLLGGADLLAPVRIETFVDHSIGLVKVHDAARAW
jgi:hypothetical protein